MVGVEVVVEVVVVEWGGVVVEWMRWVVGGVEGWMVVSDGGGGWWRVGGWDGMGWRWMEWMMVEGG